MTDEAYFFDTYAIMEIAQGSEIYQAHKGAKIVTTVLNLFELYYCACRDWERETADELVELYNPTAVEYGVEVVKEAALLRLRYRKKDLSMTDCVGYVVAKRLGVKFLTGDRQFGKMPNVEFVK